MSDWKAETIFCDDIREETSGKHILIGVYGGEMVPSSLPATFQIGFWVRFWGLGKGHRSFEMRVTDPSGTHAGTLGGETDVGSSDLPTVFAISGIPINVPDAGDIVVKFGFDGSELVEVGRLKVSRPLERIRPSTSE